MSGRRSPPGEHLIMCGSRLCSPTQQPEPYAGARAASVRMASGVGSPLSGERVVVSIFPFADSLWGWDDGRAPDLPSPTGKMGRGTGCSLLAAPTAPCCRLLHLLCVHAYVCVVAHTCVCVLRPEDNLRYHFIGITHLLPHAVAETVSVSPGQC